MLQNAVIARTKHMSMNTTTTNPLVTLPKRGPVTGRERNNRISSLIFILPSLPSQVLDKFKHSITDLFQHLFVILGLLGLILIIVVCIDSVALLGHLLAKTLCTSGFPQQVHQRYLWLTSFNSISS